MNGSQSAAGGQDSAIQTGSLQLAIAGVLIQPWVTPYSPEVALKKGTIFPSLDMPFYAGGDIHE